ncbi:hypothetical protein HMPREF1624_08530 [Sporothrix schenckii ATCC 58251]|uniref:Myb-like DNA-binding domain-containing protein n=1 Tax=Sporothrix schenckii (strain ATCC 58251 / de Perez 2211183) TaxID=1391915 RepID=U7PJF3_SPOS1|nr:hypothetical protein HMPREF1624_08530 [Sporothrix schenckii ATCC 58251]
MGSSNNGASSGESGSSGINPDKAIARLLYAMLKQKSLKDIDWNQVAADPALLERISNGHAARMRYSRFRQSIDSQVAKKAAAAAAAPKNESNGNFDEDKAGIVQQTLPRRESKTKSNDPKGNKRTGAASGSTKRLRDTESDDIKNVVMKKKEVANPDEKENKDNLSPDPDFFSDYNTGLLPDTPDKDKDSKDSKLLQKLKQDPGFLDTKTTTEKAVDDLQLSQTSFTSSLPSPPTETVPSMESIANQDRTKKLRKMYAFSPTMKPGTLHQIPLPRGAMSSSSSRILSLPTLPTATASASSSATSPVNLGGVLMMRHHSAGSMTDTAPNHHRHHPQPQMMIRQTRMMTPSSDTDLHLGAHHNHRQHFAHHTQIPIMSDLASVGGLDPTFDFGNNNGGGSNSTTGHPSPWMATPFSSPAMPAFDMSPYSTTLDVVGGGGGANQDGSIAGDTQSMPSLFQTQYNSQQQQQEQEALQASLMAQAFTKNNGWDVMLTQANSSDQNHSI